MSSEDLTIPAPLPDGPNPYIKLGYRLYCVMNGVTEDKEGWRTCGEQERYIGKAQEFVDSEEVTDFWGYD